MMVTVAQKFHLSRSRHDAADYRKKVVAVFINNDL